MMSACRGWAVSGEGFFQHFEVDHSGYVEPAPVGEATRSTLASGLVGQQAGFAVLHAVVVWLDYSWFALIGETDLMARVDSFAEWFVNLQGWISIDQSRTVFGDWIILRHH